MCKIATYTEFPILQRDDTVFYFFTSDLFHSAFTVGIFLRVGRITGNKLFYLILRMRIGRIGISEPTRAYARWAHMHHILCVCLSVYVCD